MGAIESPALSEHSQKISCAALLFDFDGTIIDSTAAIVKHWQRLGNEMNIDPNVILATSHGRRSIDVLKLYDPVRATPQYVAEMEGRIPKEFGQDAVEIPGARQVLDGLDDINAPWAVVTSGTRPLITGWLERLQLAEPKVLITAEDVENGKPDPAGYLLGCSGLGLQTSTDLIVFEDAPAGIAAGKAAGFNVVGLITTHTAEQVRNAGADWIVKDMKSVSVQAYRSGVISLELKNVL